MDDDDSDRVYAEVDAEGHIRHEFACAASLAANMGGHPENAQILENILLIAAGLDVPTNAVKHSAEVAR